MTPYWVGVHSLKSASCGLVVRRPVSALRPGCGKDAAAMETETFGVSELPWDMTGDENGGP